MSVSEEASSTPTNDGDFLKNVAKRLDALTERQDSIQALSLWMIHHKAQCQKIVSSWLAAVKRAKPPRRLIYFYLANDVVQNCKKKNAKIYLLAFKNILKDAVLLVRDPAVKHKIERIFNIWEERAVYFADFLNEMRELLNDRDKVSAHIDATNFKPQDVVDSLVKVTMLETHTAMKHKQVMNVKLDASSLDAVKQLKDRSHSHDFAKQFDDSCQKMQDYVKILEHEIEHRSKLIEQLEQSQTFYELQGDDALVVANAYRNFGIRISNLKKRLAEYRVAMEDSTSSPPPSPSAEAPSPGNTPPPDPDADYVQEVDMELSDSDEDKSEPLIVAAEPIKPIAASGDTLTMRLAEMGARMSDLSSLDPRFTKAATSIASAQISPSHGLDDGGGATQSLTSYNPADYVKRDKEKPFPSLLDTDAISYLSTFISEKAKSSSPVPQDKSVLKDLTEFAEKVKNPPPLSWSDYKRQLQRKQANASVHSDAVQPSVAEGFPCYGDGPSGPPIRGVSASQVPAEGAYHGAFDVSVEKAVSPPVSAGFSVQNRLVAPLQPPPMPNLTLSSGRIQMPGLSHPSSPSLTNLSRPPQSLYSLPTQTPLTNGVPTSAPIRLPSNSDSTSTGGGPLNNSMPTGQTNKSGLSGGPLNNNALMGSSYSSNLTGGPASNANPMGGSSANNKMVGPSINSSPGIGPSSSVLIGGQSNGSSPVGDASSSSRMLTPSNSCSSHMPIAPVVMTAPPPPPLIEARGSDKRLSSEEQQEALDLLDSLHQSRYNQSATAHDSSHIYDAQKLTEEPASSSNPSHSLEGTDAFIAASRPIETISHRGASRQYHATDRYGFPTYPDYQRAPAKRPYGGYPFGDHYDHYN